MMFGLAAISEEPCLINLPQELSLEIIQSSNSVVQREEVVNMLKKVGAKSLHIQIVGRPNLASISRKQSATALSYNIH